MRMHFRQPPHLSTLSRKNPLSPPVPAAPSGNAGFRMVGNWPNGYIALFVRVTKMGVHCVL
jgi:hypothetical protein